MRSLPGPPLAVSGTSVLLTMVSLPSYVNTRTWPGLAVVVQRTLVESPLTGAQPLPARTATRSSMVIVRPDRVITTLLTTWDAAAYCTTVLDVTDACPPVAASAGIANHPAAPTATTVRPTPG